MDTFGEHKVGRLAAWVKGNLTPGRSRAAQPARRAPSETGLVTACIRTAIACVSPCKPA